MNPPDANPRATAAVVVIGNELLSGRVRDENVAFLAGELWSLGVSLREVRFVRDGVAEIAGAVRDLASRHTWVFTTGGVGPTHDDLTMDGVAAAFDLEVVAHEALAARLAAHFGAALNAAHLRMARVPSGAQLEGEPGSWPTVRVRNVFVLPGVPSIVRKKFPALRDRLRQAPLFRRALLLRTREPRIAALLGELAEAFPEVEIGSYPRLEGEHELVQVTVEGSDEARVEEVMHRLEERTAEIPRG